MGEPTESKRLNFRPQSLSPAEEFAERLKSVAAPQRLGADVIALLMQKQERALLSGQQFTIEVNGVKRQYTSLHSVTCQPANDGKKFLVTYSLDFPDAIYVLNDAGAYVETVPLKGLVKWYDRAATQKAINEHEIRLGSARKHLEGLHHDVAVKHEARLRRNVERLEQEIRSPIVNTFPVPAQRPGATPQRQPENDRPVADPDDQLSQDAREHFPDVTSDRVPPCEANRLNNGSPATTASSPDPAPRHPCDAEHTLPAAVREAQRLHARRVQIAEERRGRSRRVLENLRTATAPPAIEEPEPVSARRRGMARLVARRAATQNSKEE